MCLCGSFSAARVEARQLGLRPEKVGEAAEDVWLVTQRRGELRREHARGGDVRAALSREEREVAGRAAVDRLPDEPEERRLGELAARHLRIMKKQHLFPGRKREGKRCVCANASVSVLQKPPQISRGRRRAFVFETLPSVPLADAGAWCVALCGVRIGRRLCARKRMSSP